MSENQPEDDRRGFASRTPDNTNPDKVVYRRGFVTKHQVTGWRFVMRRLASGVALHDTRMLVDPLRSQSRAVVTGVLAVVAGLIGCFIFSLIRPGGVAGNDIVLADRASSALYVRVNDQLHPVLNLTSARLIAGKPVDPKNVNAKELDKFNRGPMIGIPGAPERMVQNTDRNAYWAACDGVGNAGSGSGVSVIAGPLDSDGERAKPLGRDAAVLVANGSGTWVLWDGRRSAIDLNDRAVTSALGWGVDAPTPRTVAVGLFNTVPEGAPLRAPAIPRSGDAPDFPMPGGAPIGSVVVSFSADNTMNHYAVLPDGLAPVSGVLAGILRNTDSHGFAQPPRLGADEIAKLPVSRMLDNGAYPQNPLTLVSVADSPITCASWAKPDGAASASLALLSGSLLPVANPSAAVPLIPAGSSASRAAITPGYGYLVRTVGNEPTAPATGSLFWVSDTGIRYGIEAANSEDAVKTAAALGLVEAPVPAPWSVLSLLPAGPALSPADALVASTFTENRASS
ncbi:type VII secretion protein EccB [Mycolicibacterium brumae]|uniref:Type VII secretion protein EccB n=1 Tax=Mycolicibacterium brumae TaxID=85968 RepID=A0A2G5PFM6_9MYCO|nr:type VII secretion protein EccB [Mycolicibacterium brumae]MCV7192236.1 type VII secretion protein EccB [Mycolicibacterium brumae]PIB77115.1 type VII secretion protein EccB [Mycolicibacterium brumae]RWA21669.1 hypothetical protein MBRU_14430 [Mycolicibacterium brumae DSM 44177]UWW10451.1 type VII secretion protein EccB3 [Mycolicibacterium brumae]